MTILAYTRFKLSFKANNTNCTMSTISSFVDSKIKRYQNYVQRQSAHLLALKESIAEDSMKWDEGNAYRIQHEVPDDQELEWQNPGGKKRMDAIMNRIEVLSRTCTRVEQDIYREGVTLEKFLDSLEPLPEEVPVAEAPNGSDTVENNETAPGTCCPGGEQDTADSSSSDDEDDDDE